MADVNAELADRFPGKLMIAEDMQSDRAVTNPPRERGAGFGAQWDIGFVRAVRRALVTSSDSERDVAAVARALTADRADAFKRIIYTESHDENANGGSRVPEEVWPGYAHSWASKKRATLGSALVPEQKIGPGALAQGTVVVSFPVTQDAFDKRKSLSVVIQPYDQAVPVVLTK